MHGGNRSSFNTTARLPEKRKTELSLDEKPGVFESIGRDLYETPSGKPDLGNLRKEARIIERAGERCHRVDRGEEAFLPNFLTEMLDGHVRDVKPNAYFTPGGTSRETTARKSFQ